MDHFSSALDQKLALFDYERSVGSDCKPRTSNETRRTIKYVQMSQIDKPDGDRTT